LPLLFIFALEDARKAQVNKDGLKLNELQACVDDVNLLGSNIP
jgi:hypothetical protein